MASDSGFFCYWAINKASKCGGLLNTLKHNKRELPEKSHIDPMRKHLNYSLIEPKNADAQTLYKHYQKRLIDLGIIERKNVVQAIEVIFSLPASWHSMDTQPFFQSCFTWVQGVFKGELLAFDVHLDEGAPHAHALILPIEEGKLQGSKIMGSKKEIYERRGLFDKELGIPYCLPLQTRLKPRDNLELGRAVIDTMNHTNDPALHSPAWAIIQDGIKRNPKPYAELYAVDFGAVKSHKTTKTFAQIMTSRGKGKRIN